MRLTKKAELIIEVTSEKHVVIVLSFSLKAVYGADCIPYSGYPSPWCRPSLVRTTHNGESTFVVVIP